MAVGSSEVTNLSELDVVRQGHKMLDVVALLEGEDFAATAFSMGLF